MTEQRPEAERRALTDALRHLLGERGVETDADAVAPWLTDWRGRYTGSALAIVSPRDVDEVAALVRLASARRIALVPQGGNTGMVGGATPDVSGDALIVSLRRMNSIRSVDADANLAVVEAGVILQTLHEHVATHGRRFPLTLGARGSATIGGLVATNAGGTQVLRWGNMRALVAGLEAVLPDGHIWRGLDALRKDNRGYDINQLLIGAEGTLGIVTAAALRLAPAIIDRAVAWLGVATPHQALALLRWFEARHDGVESFEIVPADSLALVLAHIPETRPPLAAPATWNVLIELVGAEARRRLEELVGDACKADLLADGVVAMSEAQADALWCLRDAISEAERAAGPAMQHDVSVPVAAMPDFMIDAAAAVVARFPGTAASAFGHLGDGNVHFHVRAPAGVDAAVWRAGEGAVASRVVHDLVASARGSISAEHGIGQMKLDELERVSDPVRLHVMRAIKGALDPHGIMNPGKLVRLAPRPAAP